MCSSKLSRGYHQGILLCILCSAQPLIHLLRELRHETASYSLRASVWQPMMLQCSKQLWIPNHDPHHKTLDYNIHFICIIHECHSHPLTFQALKIRILMTLWSTRWKIFCSQKLHPQHVWSSRAMSPEPAQSRNCQAEAVWHWGCNKLKSALQPLLFGDSKWKGRKKNLGQPGSTWAEGSPFRDWMSRMSLSFRIARWINDDSWAECAKSSGVKLNSEFLAKDLNIIWIGYIDPIETIKIIQTPSFKSQRSFQIHIPNIFQPHLPSPRPRVASPASALSQRHQRRLERGRALRKGSRAWV